MLKLAAFTGGVDVPGARFRVRQNISQLLDLGIEVREFCSRFGSYPPASRYKRPLWGIATLADRLPSVLMSHKYDACLLQRELLSTFVSLEPFIGGPRIFDVDDAIWIYRGGVAAKRLAQMSDLVICGNNFLADEFRNWNSNVEIIPTGIDTTTYAPFSEKNDKKFVIGWIGTQPGFSHLRMIEPALASFLKKNKRAVFRVISDTMPKLDEIPVHQFEFKVWSKEEEVRFIQDMDVGIMPLEDSVIARGKCAFKLLQYMSCAKAIVASPIGMNADVLALGEVGYAARTTKEWVDALQELNANRERTESIGRNGRRIAIEHFDSPLIAGRIATVVRRVV